MTALNLNACLVLFVIACTAVGAPARGTTLSGATYAIPFSVLDAGEGDMGSATYRLRSSLGEPVAGVSSSGVSYKLTAGFVSAVYVPIIQVTPARLDFASQPMVSVGAVSAVQTVQITNLGAAPLSISGVTINGDFVQTNTCTSVVQGGTGCTFSVTFNPTVAGASTGTLSFTSNAPGSATQIALSGSAAAAIAASTATASPCATAVPPANRSVPVALTQNVTVHDTVAKGKTCLYSASVTPGQTYVMSVTGIVGAAELKLFSDAALQQLTPCLAPNLVNSTYAQPADCTFVAPGGTVYASVTGTSYLATAANSYNLRVSPHFEAIAATQGTDAAPLEFPPDTPYGGTVGPDRGDSSYYRVNSAGSSGDLVISMTGQTGIQSLDLAIFDNPSFTGKLNNKRCFFGEPNTFAESCILPAGGIYYLQVTNRKQDAGGPFTLMVDTSKP